MKLCLFHLGNKQMNSMLWSCHTLVFKWQFSHGAGICTGWIKITKMMKKSLFWEQLITSLSHPAPPMTFSLSLSDTHTHIHLYTFPFSLSTEQEIHLSWFIEVSSPRVYSTSLLPFPSSRLAPPCVYTHSPSLSLHLRAVLSRSARQGCWEGKKITTKMSSSLLSHTCTEDAA